MSSREIDLSGNWRGQYFYDAGMEPTWFTASIDDELGSLTGEITENSLGEQLVASLSGHQSGNSVSYIKFYHAQNEMYDEVVYRGSVSDDGDRIKGEWTFLQIGPVHFL